MRLNTVKQIVLDTDARARALDLKDLKDLTDFNGRVEALTAIYETALATLRLAIGDDETQPSWERVVALLCDIRQRVMLDALDSSPLEQARRRVACIAEMPEVVGFNSMQDIVNLIAAAVNVGAPRYNSGDVRGCAALYWTTIHLIVETPAIRGFAGYARATAQLKPVIDLEPPAGSFTAAATDAFAWELRHALDAVTRVGAST